MYVGMYIFKMFLLFKKAGMV